jgi:hypothetical protein
MVNPHSIKPQKYVDNMPAGRGDILEYRYVAIKSEHIDEIVEWDISRVLLKEQGLALDTRKRR